MRLPAWVVLSSASCVVVACGTEVVATEPGAPPVTAAAAADERPAAVEATGARDASPESGSAATPTPTTADASVDAAASPPDGGSTDWSVIRAVLGAQQNVSGSCTTNVQKLTSGNTPNSCAYADVPTLSGTGPCTAKITFADDASTGAVVATVEELAPAPGKIICPADVVSVVPTATTTITIPLALRADGTAYGTGARPGTDTLYTLIVAPGASLTLTAGGYSPSIAERQQTTSAGQCPTPLHDSTCSFIMAL